jgi:Ca2+-binding EF-hand superfamily protein
VWQVIMHVMKRHNSEEAAQKIVSTLDKDSDGIVTVQELLDWVQHREELLEELLHNENEGGEREHRGATAKEAKKQ